MNYIPAMLTNFPEFESFPYHHILRGLHNKKKIEGAQRKLSCEYGVQREHLYTKDVFISSLMLLKAVSSRGLSKSHSKTSLSQITFDVAPKKCLVYQLLEVTTT